MMNLESNTRRIEAKAEEKVEVPDQAAATELLRPAQGDQRWKLVKGFSGRI